MQLLKRLPSFRGFTLKTQSGASEKFKKGFTLIELLVVIAILGVLVTVGINLWQRAQQNARDQVRKQDLNQIKTALEIFFEANLGYTFSSAGILSCNSMRSLAWDSPFECGGVVYMRILPLGPTGTGSDPDYCFVSLEDSGTDPFPITFTLYAQMENSFNGNIDTPEVCEGEVYNYKLEETK